MIIAQSHVLVTHSSQEARATGRSQAKPQSKFKASLGYITPCPTTKEKVNSQIKDIWLPLTAGIEGIHYHAQLQSLSFKRKQILTFMRAAGMGKFIV